MNGFTDHGLSEDDFGQSKGGFKSFDAFPKTKATYQVRSRDGGAWTAVAALTCFYLVVSEIARWFSGTTTHIFTVEKGVSHELQINIDMVVAMRCTDLHVNIQDAAGDRILAGDTLQKDPTAWHMWGKNSAMHKFTSNKDYSPEDLEEDVHDYLKAGKKRKFPKTPRLRGAADSCRIFGSLEGNKVQGDFHITARGHGYMEFGEHLEHTTFNFSHKINELSFGPYYPSLVNPLDDTFATTDAHFYKFQYYLSVVPTIYTTDLRHHPSNIAPFPGARTSKTIWTNQYAVTEQSHAVGENYVPGVFVKYDIEPIALTIAEEWSGFLHLLIRLVNVISGVMVGGAWLYQLWDWSGEIVGRKKDRSGGFGVLTGRSPLEMKSPFV